LLQSTGQFENEVKIWCLFRSAFPWDRRFKTRNGP